MSIEQYFGGRIRYIQVGDNGDSQPGVGCYAKSPGISGQDIAEIRKRYRQYLSIEENGRGKKPTIYKRVVFPTGSIVMTACSYIPSPRGANGRPIDRPDWIDHSYLIRGDDSAVLDPEKWIGMPYRTDDPNPIWEVVPEGIMDRIRNGEVYRTNKWITAESLTSFPRSDFNLLPLMDVMKMWGLENNEMVDLIEAAMDCVAAPDQGGRKLFIKYDINARDCLKSEYWNHSVMDEEQFNRYRMGQLLAWIYHLIPFSFRRRLGYDTMLDANAGYHHIIFVTESRIRSMGGRQIGYVLPSFDGTSLMDNRNAMMTGGGYLYDPARGIWHDAEAGNRGYRELYKKDGIIQKLITEEVSAYTSARSMDEIRHILKEYYHFFEQLETHIPIFSNSIAELESEIPRWKAALVADPEELKGMALTLINRTGKEDIAQNTDNYDYFQTVTSALKSRTTDANRETIWLPVLEAAVTRAPFKDQVSFVDELNRVILANQNPLGKFEQYRTDKRFKGASIDGEGLIGRMFYGLAGNEGFRNAWLSSQYGNAKGYVSRLGVYESVNKQLLSMTSGMPEADGLYALNDAYYKSLPLLTDTENVRSLLTLPIGNAKTAEMAAYTARELESNYKKLDIYKEISDKGATAFTGFRNSVSASKMESAAKLVSHLLLVVFDEWLSMFTAKRMPPADLNNLASLLAEYPKDSRFRDWFVQLTNMIGSRSNGTNPYVGLTVREFSEYLNAIAETDQHMVKIACRCYLFNHAAEAIKNGEVAAGKDDLRVLSEYLTTERNNDEYCSEKQRKWLEDMMQKGTNTLIEILAAQVREEGSYAGAARLFEKLSDDNVLNCNETKYVLLNAFRKYIDAISGTGEATEEDIRTFEKAFRWWEGEPEIRTERRKIVRAANYKPTFQDIRSAVEKPSRQAFEKLSDDGFIYACERYNLSSLDSVIKTMARQPAGMSVTEWICYYCDWIEEAFRIKDLGRSPSDYYLLDVMCEAILRDGVMDITPNARVNYEWMKSLPTGNVKTDKLEKRGIRADNLITLIIAKEVCEQLGSSRAMKVDVSDGEANKVVTKMIENGKVRIRYNDKTIDAFCAYLKSDPTLIVFMLYEWRLDRIVKIIETALERANEQEQLNLQRSFNRNVSQLNQIYTDREMDLIRRALGVDAAVRSARTANVSDAGSPRRSQKGNSAHKGKNKTRNRLS